MKKNKVIPINQATEEYITAIELFRTKPCLPTLMWAMNKALESNSNFKELELETNKLIRIPNDQFFSSWGSNYYRANLSTLNQVNSFCPRSQKILDVSNILWKFLSRIKLSHLVVTTRGFLNTRDWLSIENEQIHKSSSEELDSGTKDIIKNLVDSIVKTEKISRSHAEKAIENNLEMFPSAGLLEHILDDRQELKKSLESFSQYLSSYFKNEDEIEVPELGIYRKPLNLSEENKVSIAKICSIVLFKSLVQEAVFKGSELNPDSFLEDRISYFSNYEEIDEQFKAQYILVISNILMICGVLDIDTIKNNLATHNEVRREFLGDIEQNKFFDLSILMIPPAGFPSILNSINTWEGNSTIEVNLGELFVELNYGIKSDLDEEAIDRYLEDTLSDIEVQDELYDSIKDNITSWIVPLCYVSQASRVCEDYDLLSYGIISDRISKALRSSDNISNDACVFLREDIDDVCLPIWHGEHSHPALFAREFSNKTNTLNSKPKDWIKLINSLEYHGLYQFACTLTSVTFTVQAILHHYIPQIADKLPPQKTSQLLKKLSQFNHFSFVEIGLADFFNLYTDMPPIYVGSFGSFLSKPDHKIASISSLEDYKFDKYREQINAFGVSLENLEDEASKLILKGYAISKDQSLIRMNLSLGAITNYVVAIEAELRSRIDVLDSTLIDELSALRIDVSSRSSRGEINKSSIKGLVAIARILKNYQFISDSSKNKLIGLKPLAEHDQLSFFIDSIYKLTNIRNPIQHGDLDSINETSLNQNLSEIEDLLFKKGFLAILCQTKLSGK